MRSMEKKLVLISLALAILAAGAVFIYLHTLKTPKETVKTTTVLVAAEAIPPRTLIEKKMIKEIKAPESTMFDGYLKDQAQIVGKYTKEAVSENEGFNADKLMGDLDNFNELSLKIASDHRAVSINVTGDSGVSDLVKPGDYVDVIVYLAEKRDGDKVIRPDMAKTILQNIEILAVDKVLNRDDSSKDDGKMPTNFLVAISVPVKDIEKLVLAEDIGSLKLALRPANNSLISNTGEITEEDLLAEAGGSTGISKTDTSDKVKAAGTLVLGQKNILPGGKTKYRYYKVRYKDTLKKISRLYYGNSDGYVLIQRANKIKDENHIVVGSTIRIPVVAGMR